MTFNVYYKDLKHFDEKTNKFTTSDGLALIEKENNAERKQANDLGWLLMYCSMNEITQDNIEEILFRMNFHDKVHGSAFLNGDNSLAQVRRKLIEFIGLRTNFGKEHTRHRFIVNVARTLASDVGYKLTKDLCGINKVQ